MAIPEVLQVYPADEDTGIPTGSTIKIYFSCGVDAETAKNSVVVYGRDFDVTSGPDQALWADNDTGDNPFFLTSPGFKGIIPIKTELVYYTLGTTDEVDVTILQESDEVDNNVGHLLKVTVDPKHNVCLPADTEITVIIIGNPDSLNTGISGRTWFDIDSSAVVGEGFINLRGTWIDPGIGEDTLNIKVTTGGDVGTAIVKHWYTSEGEGAAVTDQITSRRYRSLKDGLQIRFSGSNFAVNDVWTFNVKPIERLAENYKFTFTTNDGSYTVAPDSPSTPASSSPPSTVLPTLRDSFTVLKMLPENGTYNVSVKNRKITLTFSEEVDADTITNETIKLYKYPVSGSYEDTYNPIELQKTIEVDGEIVTIRF